MSLPRMASPADPSLAITGPIVVTDWVDRLLDRAKAIGASDVHLQPGDGGLEVRWRLDGVLHPIATLPTAVAPNVVARLKVLADLLTYRNDVPQEGRIRAAPGGLELRVSTFPTLYGERAVVRLFPGAGSLKRIDDLGFPAEVEVALRRLLGETSGAIVLAGPAGSGKTTTIYACLRELAERSQGSRCLATLEDPIEVALPGVVQSQVNPAAGFDLATGLRSLLRQDPEVIAVGEIRDAATAEVAFQASLTGHLVLTTFHAGGAAAALGRLADMGIEPYLLRSGLRAVIGQRLLRRLCPDCSRPIADDAGRLGLPVESASEPVGCPECRGTGYRGRIVIAEWLDPDAEALGSALLARSDVARLHALAVGDGMVPLWDRARAAVADGRTSPAETRRVLGFNDPWSAR